MCLTCARPCVYLQYKTKTKEREGREGGRRGRNHHRKPRKLLSCVAVGILPHQVSVSPHKIWRTVQKIIWTHMSSLIKSYPSWQAAATFFDARVRERSNSQTAVGRMPNLNIKSEAIKNSVGPNCLKTKANTWIPSYINSLQKRNQKQDFQPEAVILSNERKSFPVEKECSSTHNWQWAAHRIQRWTL